ncbi:MAG: DEAD/DEAH box helicase [Candidatus Latescibacteria bacterium]|nr:DEAD/DEAH box helicase [Candidatus Latescibacterota bacterium]
MSAPPPALQPFHPLVAEWFTQKIGAPTDVQAQAWPRIAAGEHVLVTAPTGSGKTLTAFLWALDQLLRGSQPTGQTSILYISPLKALNNDIQRNLISPLDQLKNHFEAAGAPFPDIRVLTRSGDTPQSDRRRMLRHPPEILITTPESLNILINSSKARTLLSTVRTVILDEVHAVVSSKRGTHLITAVERMVPLCGEFQRLALSATVRPLEKVGQFVGGYQWTGSDYTPRPVALVRSTASKQYQLSVRLPEGAGPSAERDDFWRPLVDDFRRRIEANRSTLLFANSRRLCEYITLQLNGEADQPLAYAHHGSLARELRQSVEQKLKAGQLRAIVATNSLELGIDIGALDEVVLIQSPPSVAAAVQRLGRAGHQVGEVSRGTLYPTQPRDFLDAAVLARAIAEQDIEAVNPVQNPLDVLAQIVVAMCTVEPWPLDDLYNTLRLSYPFHNLPRKAFDLTVEMLAGRYADSRVRALKPRLSLDRIDQTVQARPGSLQAVHMAGGTIPDRGYFTMRHRDSKARIGELDEEFVWENPAGSQFNLGTQSWQVEEVTHSDVLVRPIQVRDQLMLPFWKGESLYRDDHFSQRIGHFLQEADPQLEDPAFFRRLQSDHAMEPEAAEYLLDFLRRQRKATGCPLPHRHHLVAECVGSGPRQAPERQLVLHTLWGGRINRPYALALEGIWEERFGYAPQIYPTDDYIAILLSEDIEADEVVPLIHNDNLESALRRRLEGSGFFGARFRECAGRALLLNRTQLNRRTPLWISRMRAQQLMEAVLEYEDFPLLLETWRTCLQDEFDLDGLRRVLDELAAGTIAVTQVHTPSPSPFAATEAWWQVNQYMYMDDALNSVRPSKLRPDLLREVVFDPQLRPQIAPQLVDDFIAKRQRLSPGYAPQNPRDLLDWLDERRLLPRPEWEQLLQAIARDHQVDPLDWLAELEDKLVELTPAGARAPLVAARQGLAQLLTGLYSGTEIPLFSLAGAPFDPPAPLTEPLPAHVLVGEWLSFYGPSAAADLAAVLGLEPDTLQTVLDDLLEAEQIIEGILLQGDENAYLCDGENFEILLRLARAAARPVFEPLPATQLPLFLAQIQGLTKPGTKVDDLYPRLENLLAYPAPAAAWEGDILPARLDSYATSWLDQAVLDSDLLWLGVGQGRTAFAFVEELDLLPPGTSPDWGDLFPDPTGRYDFSALQKRSGLATADLAARLWQGVWAGQLSNDSYQALRRGVDSRFAVPDMGSPSARGRRGRAARWQQAVPFAGNWHRLPQAHASDDPLERQERDKDRVRLLLDRYGLLCRELLQREHPALRWGPLFRSLRLMELSGEVLSGLFFEGVPGPQFIAPAAFRRLQEGLPQQAVYWLNAIDPASLCGVDLPDFKGRMPKRLSGNHLVYRGAELMLVSQRHGKSLDIHAPADDPDLGTYWCSLRHLLNRASQPLPRVTVESINGQDAGTSPYLQALRRDFDLLVDYKQVELLAVKRG